MEKYPYIRRLWLVTVGLPRGYNSAIHYCLTGHVLQQHKDMLT